MRSHSLKKYSHRPANHITALLCFLLGCNIWNPLCDSYPAECTRALRTARARLVACFLSSTIRCSSWHMSLQSTEATYIFSKAGISNLCIPDSLLAEPSPLQQKLAVSVLQCQGYAAALDISFSKVLYCSQPELPLA